MCKLFSIVEVENQEKAERFAKLAIPFITKTDNHGLGIMRLGENGTHIQRWLNPPTVMRSKKSKSLLKYEKALKHQQNEEGERSRDLYAIAIHGRFATCDKSLQNTHPFYRDGSALMHNGIIPNAVDFKRVLSTCDSEALLSQYLAYGVSDSQLRLTDALKGVGGYYASIVFNDNGTIDIWRDDTATLYLAHVRGVGVVIATTEEIIIQTAKKQKAFITGIDEILPFTVIRWRKGLSPTIGTFEAIKPAPAVVGFNQVNATYGYGKDEERWFEHEENWKVLSDGKKSESEYGIDSWKAWEDADLTEEDAKDLRELKRLQGRKENL